MSKTITISLPDVTYDALQAAAAQAHRPPEEVAASALAERFPATSSPAEPSTATAALPSSDEPTPEQWQQFRERFFNLLRQERLLVDPKQRPQYPGTTKLPPRGTPERAEFEERLAEELGEAWEAWAESGKSILDLVER